MHQWFFGGRSRRRAEAERRKEIEEYSYNPNEDTYEQGRSLATREGDITRPGVSSGATESIPQRPELVRRVSPDLNTGSQICLSFEAGSLL